MADGLPLSSPSLLPKPLYPLYAMVTGAVDFTDADVELIGSNFNYCHCTTTPEQTAAFKRVNPAFRSVKYNNPSGTGTSPGEYASMEAFERDHRMGSGGGWYVGGRAEGRPQVEVVREASKAQTTTCASRQKRCTLKPRFNSDMPSP